MRKIAVVGSRDFKDKLRVRAWLSKLIWPGDELVSGGARGPDRWAEGWAGENGIRMTIFHPDWSVGKHAGFLRNTQIVEHADCVISFWDGISGGTQDTMKKAEKKGIPLLVIFETDHTSGWSNYWGERGQTK
jgi:hypothetical protein